MNILYKIIRFNGRSIIVKVWDERICVELNMTFMKRKYIKEHNKKLDASSPHNSPFMWNWSWYALANCIYPSLCHFWRVVSMGVTCVCCPHITDDRHRKNSTAFDHNTSIHRKNTVSVVRIGSERLSIDKGRKRIKDPSWKREFPVSLNFVCI